MKTSKFFKKTAYLYLLGILLVNSQLNAQVSQQWAARYNNGSTDICNAMKVDVSGNVYLTGSSRSGGFFTEDIATLKYNSSGTLLWSKRYAGAGYGEDHGFAIAIDAAGNSYVTGRTWINAGSNNDIVTIKYNPAGDSLWVAKYNGTKSNHDEASAICVDASGNVYVTGTSQGLVGPNGIFEDFVAIKYNSTGVQQWAFRYNGPAGGFDKGRSVAVDISGNVYAIGTSWGGSGSGGTGFDMVALKLNSSGVSQWINRYSGAGNGDDELLDLVIEPSGTLYACGFETSTTQGKNYKTLKISSAGALVWSNTYNGPDNDIDEAYSIAIDRTGNVVVTGKSDGGASSVFDMATVKYNFAGVESWAQRFNGLSSSYDEGKDVAFDSAGNVYVTGYSSNPTTAQDYQTIKYNSAGLLQWEIKYSNSGAAGSSDQAVSIYADNTGNVYAAGSSSLDYAVVKYGPFTSVSGNNTIAKGFELMQNFPNPFNPNSKIKYQISNNNQNVKIAVFDITGKEIAQLVNQKQNAGTYEVDFNGTNYSTGTYFYSLIVDGHIIDTKKMMLVK